MDQLISENAASLPTVTTERQKSKRVLLPILIVLFVFSYGLMCTLVIEQGSTIDAQRSLIHQLLGDSTELSALKGRAFQNQRDAKAKAEAQAQASGKVPPEGTIPGSAQIPPAAQSSPQAPALPAAPRANNKGARSTGKLRTPVPRKPPQDTSEMADERRNLISI